MARQFVGDFNHIYFLQNSGAFAEIRDRGQRKPGIPFAEDPLEDLLVPQRERGDLTFHTTMPSAHQESEVRFGDRTLPVAGEAQTVAPLSGFGYRLEYQRVKTRVRTSSVLL